METNGAFKIEDGIPIPEDIRGMRPGYSRILRALEVGQSFFIAETDLIEARKYQSRISAAGRTIALRKSGAGRKFVTRKFDDGIRVWRTA